MKKEMLINVLQPEECRIAIVEDGILEELYVERTSHESYTGNIYKGKIVNLEPAIQAAFVDFSVGRNGFLHVSDVEPQYFQRHQAAEEAEGAPPSPSHSPRDRDREPKRERDSYRRGRADDRDVSPPTPSDARGDERYRDRDRDRGRDRDRDRDRDRPDLSEKGRRDRSEPRQFGEGLSDDDLFLPPPRPVAPERVEPRRPRVEPSAPSWRDEPVERIGWGSTSEERKAEPEPPRSRTARSSSSEPDETRGRLPRTPETDEPRSRLSRASELDEPRTRFPRTPDLDEPRSRSSRAVEPEEPRSRLPRASESQEPRSRTGRAPEPLDPDLPPSRTQRNRGGSSSTPSSFTSARPSIESEPIEETPRERIVPDPESPQAREPRRSRGRSRSDRERLAPEPEADLGFAAELDVPAPAEPIEEREEETPRRRGGRAAIRSRGGDREPLPERSRPAPADRPVEENLDRPRERVREPERTRDSERARPSERTRSVEAEAPRERRPHGRAGEPGYVPRRERSRDQDSPFDSELSHAALEWADSLLEPDTLDNASDTGHDELGTDSSKPEGTRRRRRRRGRRRDREHAEETPTAAGRSELDPDLDLDSDEDDDSDFVEPTPRTRSAPRQPVAREKVEDPIDEFDFDEELGSDEHDSADDYLEEPVAVAVDEEIDPELEEEIRREIAEIAELEREMGLRGPIEARPRRGDQPTDAEGGRTGRFTRGRGVVKPPIQDVFRRGDEVLVQVIKESIGTKGPTLSTYISIPGRYLVLMPGLNRVGVSRKIADESQRRKLREIMNELNPPKGLGFIVRTAGLERSKRELARDLAYLLRLWKVILRRIKKARTPAPIYQESDMITRTIRDIFTSEIDTIWIDEPAAFERAQEFLKVVMPRFVNRLKFYDEKVPLFHKYGIEDEIAKIQRRTVPLPEGGSIVIDQTEALVAIDVNSGNFRVENDAERTAYEMNLRAAKEIARQLRLRDLGGVIVNDFIDMRDERHRRGVEKALRDAIKRDRARTKVLRMSAFGLIEMTRQRIRPSLKRSVYEDCSNCTGAGVIKTVESMSIDVMRLLALASNREDVRRVSLAVSPPVAAYLNNRKRREISRIENEANLTIQIRSEPDGPAEHLQFECFDGNSNEVRLISSPTPPNHRRGH